MTRREQLATSYIADCIGAQEDASAEEFATEWLDLLWASLSYDERLALLALLKDEVDLQTACDDCGGSERTRDACTFCDEDGRIAHCYVHLERPAVERRWILTDCASIGFVGHVVEASEVGARIRDAAKRGIQIVGVYETEAKYEGKLDDARGVCSGHEGGRGEHLCPACLEERLAQSVAVLDVVNAAKRGGKAA